MDLIKFAERYRVYNNPIEGRLEYGGKLLTYQSDFLDSLVENRFTISLASRQMTMTTLLATYIAHTLIFGTEEKLIYISPKLDQSRYFVNIVRDILAKYINENPDTVVITNTTKLELFLSNGNRIKAMSSSTDSMRGYSVTKVFIDQAAFIRNLEDIYSAIMSSLATNGCLHMVTTPNGLNFFASLYLNQSSFLTRRYRYTLNPIKFTPQHIKQLRNDIDERIWQQEMELEFVTNAPFDYLIQCRVKEDIFTGINQRLILKKESMSNYLRGLIQDDLKNNSI